jgi:hypothetical protein
VMGVVLSRGRYRSRALSHLSVRNANAIMNASSGASDCAQDDRISGLLLSVSGFPQGARAFPVTVARYRANAGWDGCAAQGLVELTRHEDVVPLESSPWSQ